MTRTALCLALIAGLFIVSCSSGEDNPSLDNSGTTTGSTQISDSNSIQINLLEASDDGGPELTNIGLDDAGIHLRRFISWTNPGQARAELSAMSFSDGGDRSALANVLVREGGTLVALFTGLQSSSGVVNADIESVEVSDERLTVMVKTQVVGSCSADGGFAAPFRILHIAATAPNVFFREAIHQCIGNETINTTDVRDITIKFLDDATARIDWEPPIIADDQTRYDVIDTDREQKTFDGTDESSYTIDDIVPGVIYTRTIVPIDMSGEVLSRGTSIALMVDAPSGVFRGRASREDLEALKIQLAGEDAKDCGEITVPFNNGDSAAQVFDCVDQALDQGIAFTAETTIQGEAFSFDSLVSDGEGNSWLLMQGNSDINLFNDFSPSTDFGGYLTGQVCSRPAVSLNTNFSQLIC